MPTAAARCPHRHYRTERYAKRQAWSLDENPETRPTPVRCECGCGAWRLAAHDQQPEAKNR